MSAIESRGKHYLAHDELRDYRAAARSIEKLENQLEQLLEGESLRLFNLYVENRNEEGHWEDISSFRRGLAMGLKLGSFAASEY